MLFSSSLIIYPYWILITILQTFATVATTYNLSILDFKFVINAANDIINNTYNLSILDFKGKHTSFIATNIFTYNLSILDFKLPVAGFVSGDNGL